jgi:ATP-dependent protease HslVU (ClpYQ) peptidase subunit
MAADGMGTCGDTIVSTNERKLSKLPDGSIIAGSGDLAAMQRAINYLHAPNTSPDDFTGEFSLLRLYADGSVVRYDGSLFPLPAQVPAAIGSGTEIAIGAMCAGAEPSRAVEIASERDTHTGGEITVMRPDRPNVVELVA